MIAGLIPMADGTMTEEMRRALVQRQELLEARATALAQAAVAQQRPWLRKLGNPPTDQHQRALWMREVRVVAAYRDLYGIDSDSPIASSGMTDRQRVDQARVRNAVRRAADIAVHGGDRTNAPTRDIRMLT